MKLLLTGDWQATAFNLEKIEALTTQIVRWVKKYKIRGVVHTGDMKDAYNPVDVRVVNACIRSIHRIQKAGAEFFLNFGNHDGLSMSGTDHWFPALTAAGAHCFFYRGAHTIGKHTLHFVPYRRDVKTARAMLHAAGKKANPETDLLVFHHEVIGTKFNAHTEITEGVRIEDLHLDRYMFAFGGHIHRFQKFADNAAYIGSPFAHGWGEVNERKRLVLWDSQTNEGKFLFTDLLKDRITENRMLIGGVLLGYGIVRLFMWWRWHKAQEQAEA